MTFWICIEKHGLNLLVKKMSSLFRKKMLKILMKNYLQTIKLKMVNYINDIL